MKKLECIYKNFNEICFGLYRILSDEKRFFDFSGIHDRLKALSLKLNTYLYNERKELERIIILSLLI